MEYPLLITPLTVAVVMAAGAVAGGLGALLGIGGGVFLVPFLNSVIGLPIKIAVATSLMTVIATSSAVSAGTVGRNLINLRLGMLLEVASAAGGVAAGLTFHALSDETLFLWFALVTGAHRRAGVDAASIAATCSTATVDPGRLGGRFFEEESGREVVYRVKRLPVALGVSALAGVVSGSLGIGGGILKVPLLNAWCGVPLRAAAATSALMIGVTAAGVGADPVRQPLHPAAARRRGGARRAGRLARRPVVRRPGEGALAQDADRRRAGARVARPLRESCYDDATRTRSRASKCTSAALFVVGVSVSAALLAVGLALFLVAPDAPAASRLLNAGLLVLMATPMLRVLALGRGVRADGRLVLRRRRRWR